VDCAGLAVTDAAELLAEISAQLHGEGVPAPDLSRASIRHTLKAQVLGLEPNLNLVLALDYFDDAAASLDKTFFNFLFHLRNARPKGNLSYIFVTRRPPEYLHELHELLDDSCIVGPLSYKDALNSLRRDEARLGCSFQAAQRDRLIRCTGGHPGFLKNAAELLSSGEFGTHGTDGEMARQLLRAEKVKNLCQELWSDLTPAEQTILLNSAHGMPVNQALDPTGLRYLEQGGLLVRQVDERGGCRWAVFCPLLEAFVRQVTSFASPAVRVTPMFPNQAYIQAPHGEERVALSPKLFALLMVLAETPGQVLPTAEIITRVYGDEAAGVTDAALSQLVKRLRGILDPHIRQLAGAPAYTCIETIRDVGYKLVN
jgi:DNA-binding winged helix-turn-helix (wHTH) protein